MAKIGIQISVWTTEKEPKIHITQDLEGQFYEESGHNDFLFEIAEAINTAIQTVDPDCHFEVFFRDTWTDKEVSSDDEQTS